MNGSRCRPAPESCQTCHAMINPLGFTLEPFDAVGRFRREENGRSIDATGAYQTRTGEQVKFTGARDLATFLAGSPETQATRSSNRFSTRSSNSRSAPSGLCELDDLRASFAEENFNIRKLVVKIAADTALTPRQTQSKSDVGE